MGRSGYPAAARRVVDGVAARRAGRRRAPRGRVRPAAAGIAAENLTTIELEPLARDDVEELLATVCGQSGELPEVAAEFHHRTGGNPLQVRQLLYRAQREGALLPVGSGGPRAGTCGCSPRSRSRPPPPSSSAATSTSSAPPTGRC
ncbi:GAF domain protein [Mycobacterium avium subsp. avium 2285 (R)]|nr:GAF domain protein [Mycobacterium avium subsp. avium 2285 (R)]